MCADFQNSAVQFRRIGYRVHICSHLPSLSHASHTETKKACVNRAAFVKSRFASAVDQGFCVSCPPQTCFPGDSAQESARVPDGAGDIGKKKTATSSRFCAGKQSWIFRAAQPGHGSSACEFLGEATSEDYQEDLSDK